MFVKGQRFTSLHDGFADRLQETPNLRPAFARPLAEALWVFAVHQVAKAIVIYLYEVWSPEQ